MRLSKPQGMPVEHSCGLRLNSSIVTVPDLCRHLVLSLLVTLAARLRREFFDGILYRLFHAEDGVLVGRASRWYELSNTERTSSQHLSCVLGSCQPRDRSRVSREYCICIAEQKTTPGHEPPSALPFPYPPPSKWSSRPNLALEQIYPRFSGVYLEQ